MSQSTRQSFIDLDSAAREAGIMIQRYNNETVTKKTETVQEKNKNITPMPEWKRRMKEEQAIEAMHEPVSQQERVTKAAELKKIIDTKLTPELDRLTMIHDKFIGEIEEYKNLKSTAELLKLNGEKEMITKVNLGNNIYTKAQIPNARRLMVDIGLGFFVECTLDETVEVCNKKITILENKVEDIDSKTSSLIARIKILHDGLGQFLDIGPVQEKTRREIF